MKGRLPDIVLIIMLGLWVISTDAQSHSDAEEADFEEMSVASWSEAGFKEDSIRLLLNLIRETPPPDFRGMVVIKDGSLVIEEYFSTYWRETIHDIRSAGKSVTALLVGIAIDQGLIRNVDQSVYDFFADGEYQSILSPAYRDIRLGHLLTMSSGLDADSDNSGSRGNAGNWVGRKDWLKYVLALPSVDNPGENWVYTDVCAFLLGAIVEEVSGLSLEEFAGKYLFKPIGIDQYYWFSSPMGRTAGMGNLYLSTLDFARIGQMVLNKGAWQGRQIVSAKWIAEISKPWIDISGNNPFSEAYGYLWYLAEREIEGETIEFFFASGNGGNILVIIPDKQMVVALLSSAYGQGYGHQRSHNILLALINALQ